MRSIFSKALMISVVWAPLAQAASETTSPGDEIDQVTVEATRDNVVRLGKEVKTVQMQFYELYNTLNKKRDYAIDCDDTPATGSRFTRTSCQPYFKSKAAQQEARDFLIAFGAGDQVTGTPGGIGGPVNVNAPPPEPSASAGSSTPAGTGKRAKDSGFKQNMLEITRKNPKLLELAQKHAELWTQYYTLYRKLNGAGPPEAPDSAGSGTSQAASPTADGK